MRKWQRAVQPVPCGGLHDQLTTIPIGAPVLVITPEKTRALYRCESCADEPVPNLPQLAGVEPQERQPAPMAKVNFAALTKVLPFDVKSKQVGSE